MKKNKSITSTLIESTSLKAENKHIYFRIPRQVDYDVELVWGIPKRKNSARVAPNDKNNSPVMLKDKKPGMGTMVTKNALRVKRSKSGHDLTRISLNQFNLKYAYKGKDYPEAQDQYAKVYADQTKYWFRGSLPIE